MSHKRTPWGRIFLGLLVVGIAVPAFWLYPGYRLANAFSPDDLRRYEDVLTDGTRPEPESAIPPRSGKVALVIPGMRKPGGKFLVPTTRVKPNARQQVKEVEPPRLHDAMYDLDSSLRAGSPAEVETVIFCVPYIEKLEDVRHWETETHDYWMTSAKGRRGRVLVYVYDLASRNFLGCYDVEGPIPELKAGRFESPQPPDLAAFVATMPLGGS